MSRVTIRDVADTAGVSVSTAHLVLAGKSGPKAETRDYVMEIAERLGYQSNSVASSLKRGVTKIAAILPSPADDSLFYYAPIWDGMRAFCESVKDFNIELVELPYVNRDMVSVPLSAVRRAKKEGKISGLIALGDIEGKARAELKAMSDGGIPIVLVNSDEPSVGRICCIQAENYLLGRIMGEILFGKTTKDGTILVCAGEKNTPANYESARGLEDYIKERTSGQRVHRIWHANDMKLLYGQLSEQLEQNPEIIGCCSVTARGSVQLAKALSDTGMAGKLPAIGSDVFPRNMESLKRGIFQNLMFKNPYQQGWQAAEQLFKHIFRAQYSEGKVILVKGEVVFQSSVSMYE